MEKEVFQFGGSFQNNKCEFKVNMNLIDLIDFFKKGQDFKTFCTEQSINADSEVIEVYMHKPFNVKSEIFFFEIEDTEGLTKYEFNSKTYYNLFDFYYFQDVINDSSIKLSSEELANVLLSYSINDA